MSVKITSRSVTPRLTLTTPIGMETRPESMNGNSSFLFPKRFPRFSCNVKQRKGGNALNLVSLSFSKSLSVIPEDLIHPAVFVTRSPGDPTGNG